MNGFNEDILREKDIFKWQVNIIYHSVLVIHNILVISESNKGGSVLWVF